MKLLLDTHVLLWLASEPDRIGISARAELENGDNQVLVSVVSAWEIAIKQSVGKLTLSRPAEAWLPDVLRRSGLEGLVLSLGAALRVRAVPDHYRQPFDLLRV